MTLHLLQNEYLLINKLFQQRLKSSMSTDYPRKDLLFQHIQTHVCILTTIFPKLIKHVRLRERTTCALLQVLQALLRLSEWPLLVHNQKPLLYKHTLDLILLRFIYNI